MGVSRPPGAGVPPGPLTYLNFRTPSFVINGAKPRIISYALTTTLLQFLTTTISQ
jgi:hypothetical protein